jgi:hypothetical protein
MIELTVGLIITCIAPVSKLARLLVDKRLGDFFGGNTYPAGSGGGEIQMKPRRKHFPGGLSELDSMKAFETTVYNDGTRLSSREALHTPLTQCSSAVNVDAKPPSSKEGLHTPLPQHSSYCV